MPFCLVAGPLCRRDRNKAGIILLTRDPLFVWINALQNVIKIYRETKTKCQTLIWFTATRAKGLNLCHTHNAKSWQNIYSSSLLQMTLVRMSPKYLLQSLWMCNVVKCQEIRGPSVCEREKERVKESEKDKGKEKVREIGYTHFSWSYFQLQLFINSS